MPSEIPGGPEAPARKPWGKIAAVIVVLIVIIAAVAAYTFRQNRPPAISQVAVSSEAAQVGDSLTFTALATDPDGDALTYAWDFGDGSTGSGGSATHSYSLAGRFIALVTVSDGRGGSVTNDNNLVFVQVKLPSTDVRAPSDCPGATCAPGPVISVLAASSPTVATGTAVSFNGNSSWAYAFAWNDPANHALGGTYSVTTAADDSTLFSRLAYAWGDTTANTTGTSIAVGTTTHTFTTTGNFFVKLTVTYTNPDLTPTVKTGVSGYTVRVVAASPSTTTKYPDIFTEVTFGEPDYLDPAVDYETAGGEVLQNVYETLIWYNQTINGGSESVTDIVARLATAVPQVPPGSGISADGKNYTFNLKPGVPFHSGGTMSADDVVYSIQRVLTIHDPDGPSWILEQVLTNYVSYATGGTVGDWVNSSFPSRADVPQNIRTVIGPEPTWNTEPLTVTLAQAIGDSSVEKTGPMQVVFHLTHAYPAFLQAMAFTVGSVLSKACVVANGGTQWATHNSALDGGVDCGTGPFKIRTWERNQVIIMDRFDTYHRTRAAMKEIHIAKANSVTTREFMLRSGDADVATVPRDHQYDILDRNTGQPLYSTIRVIKDKPTFTVLFFGYNQNINIAGSPDPVLVPANFFADVHVRKTFSYAFDYTSFINNVIYGGGTQLRGPIPQGMFGYNSNIPLFAFDKTKASAELIQTPFWATGFTITLYYNAGNTVREQGCLLLKQGLESLPGAHGPISVSVRALDWPVYLATLRAKGLPIFFLGWAPDYADPDDYVVPFLRTGGTFPNRVGYSNTSLDTLIDQAGSELNQANRQALYFSLTYDAVVYDVPYLWIYQATSFNVQRTWVGGYYFNPMLSGLDFYPMTKT